MDLDDVLKLLITVSYLFYEVITRYRKYTRSRRRPPEIEISPPGPSVVSEAAERASLSPSLPMDSLADPFAEERRELTDRLSSIESEASQLASSARLQRATTDFAQVLEAHVAQPAAELRANLIATSVIPSMAHSEGIADLELVLAQLELFVHQRRDPVLRASLGDADALALACYRPLIDFAAAEGLPLSSATPVTQLGGYDLAIWTGFIPTGLAPIFLPPSFFETPLWWPALAHEIAHDFLAAANGVEPALRLQLGLPDAIAGRAALPLGREPLNEGHLWRLLGGWFEEVFCDIVGTLMLGPSYVQSMARLFARPDQVAALAVVERAKDGHYGYHPPRQLRLQACTYLLERMGDAKAADQVQRHWISTHGELPEHIYLPHQQSYAALPAAPLITLLQELVDRLYDEQLTGLAGYSLPSIPGLGFGPSMRAQTSEAVAALLENRPPPNSHARPVIAAAVLATCAEPQRAFTFMELARRAILATGTFEHAPLPGLSARSASNTAAAGDRRALRRALILHTVLAPRPLASGGTRLRPGLLSRPNSARQPSQRQSRH